MARALIATPETIDPALTWYIARSATQRERAAVEGLTEAGFAVYLPTLTRWVRHSRVKSKVQRPLFVGYLFVGVDHARQSIYEAVKVDGVHDIVRLGSPEPRPVRVADIEQIRGAEALGVFDQTKPTKARATIEKGERLRVVAGPFFGFIVDALEVPQKDRIKVMFQLFGRSSPMELGVEQLERVA